MVIKIVNPFTYTIRKKKGKAKSERGGGGGCAAPAPRMIVFTILSVSTACGFTFYHSFNSNVWDTGVPISAVKGLKIIDYNSLWNIMNNEQFVYKL